MPQRKQSASRAYISQIGSLTAALAQKNQQVRSCWFFDVYDSTLRAYALREIIIPHVVTCHHALLPLYSPCFMIIFLPLHAFPGRKRLGLVHGHGFSEVEALGFLASDLFQELSPVGICPST